MSVMNAAAPGALLGDAQISQSISVILSTPAGSRVCRRDFGSELPALIDQPVNAGTRQRLLGATALALLRWMPSLRITRVQLVRGDTAGAWTVILDRQRADGSTSPLSATLSL